MKKLFSVLAILILGMYAFLGLYSIESSSAEFSENATEQKNSCDVISISDVAVELYAISPTVQYSAADKLRNKRRTIVKVESSLVSSFVLCALTAVLAEMFYKKFLLNAKDSMIAHIKDSYENIPLSGNKPRIFALLI